MSCDCCLSSHITFLIASDSIAIEHTKRLVAMKRQRQLSDIRSFLNKKAAQEDSGKPGSSLDLYLLRVQNLCSFHPYFRAIKF